MGNYSVSGALNKGAAFLLFAIYSCQHYYRTCCIDPQPIGFNRIKIPYGCEFILQFYITGLRDPKVCIPIVVYRPGKQQGVLCALYSSVLFCKIKVAHLYERSIGASQCHTLFSVIQGNGFINCNIIPAYIAQLFFVQLNKQTGCIKMTFISLFQIQRKCKVY